MNTAPTVATPPGARPATPPAAPGGAGGQPLARLPIVLIAVFFGFLLLPRVQQSAAVVRAFVGVGAALLAWQGVLWLLQRRRGRPLAVEWAPPVRQHYIQACVQLCLYAYWGWHWRDAEGGRPIYAQAPLILAQLVFLYAFDALFAWSRGRTWRLASGPTPIVLSTNLFIWFRDDWFVLQFAMVAIGLLGKEFVKWQREGRRTHVFNPSGFGLAVAATVLIATGSTDLTWAKPLATTIEVPHVFVFLFVLGMVVQYFFAVTLMTFAAALVMVGLNVAYTQTTGVYLFGSTNLPAAAFLGLHLLMTDPSTSPRTNLGRALFGAGYGLGYVVMFELLGRIGAPELFAKLYPVPILNCCVRFLDRRTQVGWLGGLNRRWETALPKKTMNLVHMGAWAAVFATMLATGYVEQKHPGDSIPFWKQALAADKPDAARKLVMVAGSQAVGRNSADAFNELGLLSLGGRVAAADEKTTLKSAAHWFHLAAERGSLQASENIVMMFLFVGARRSDEDVARALQRLEQAVGRPEGAMACYLLGFACETGRGRPQDLRRALDLYRRCGPGHVLASKGVVRIGLSPGSLADLTLAAVAIERAAAAGDAESCWYLAYLHHLGRGVARDAAKSAAMRARAVELGFEPALAARQSAELPPFVPPNAKAMQRPDWSTAFPL